ncbi:hypothetical protein MNBD_NITROSPINAE02-973 [hydrothermal vent metagenome]|uniref:Uncharacterized protein n=1 Tax=hydrothermal vent metagenome TaxID=652676 RepID=A0A3B1C8Z2_9ZZZZ
MKRAIRQGSFMAIFILFVVGVVVIINLLSINHHKKFDLTSRAIYSLSGQTKKLLSSLKENITAYAFVRSDRRLRAQDILEQYSYLSDKFRFQVVDPDKQPALAKKYKITDYDIYILETESGRRTSIKNLKENDITNAILKATTTDEKIVYIMEGHKERSIKGDKPRHWTRAVAALEEAAYKVKPLNWFTTGKTPEDADLVIIAGPKKDFQPVELDLLRELADMGTSIFITIDPDYLPNLTGYLREFGFKFNEDIIVDPVSQQLGFEWLLATAATYGKHPIVAELKAATFFWVARSIEFVFDNKRKTNLSPVGSTAPQSWSELELKSIEKGEPKFSKEKDLKGPRMVMVAGEYPFGPKKEELKIGETQKKGRIVVAGDSDFAANSYIDLSANKDIFLNAVGWLLAQENSISIRPKTRGFNPIMFTGLELNVIFFVAVTLVPVLVIISGVIVWIKRKRA